jgi:Recombinase
MGSMARKGNAASATVRRAASAKRNEDLLPVIEDIRGAGLTTPQQIAASLNERGITAARGGSWSGVQVRRILKNSTGRRVDAQRVTQDNQETIAA